MATISISEIRKYLIELGRADVIGSDGKPRVEFLEVRFDSVDAHATQVIDEDYANKSISVETHYGSGVILFDQYGYLKSIDFS